MVGGVANRLGDVLGATLFDPQEAGNSPVFGAARALAGKPEPQQFGQVLLGLFAIELLRPGLEFTTLAVHETLAQPVVGATDREVQLDRRCGRRFAPGQQVVHAGGAVPLEEGRADGANQGAFTSLVGTRKQVQARGEARKLEGLAKLPQLLDAQPLQPHAGAPGMAWRSDKIPASTARAWAATAALSAGPTWRSRKSVMTSPR